MAEKVQINIENSVRELEQLERVGLFTAAEIKKVIKRRKTFEYKLARRHKDKEDYLKYMQYELGVLSLVKKRREHVGYKFKKDEIDDAIGRRINSLFKAAIKRYPQDTKLWLSHRQFLRRMHWYDNMSGMLARMLQYHSKTPGVWIMVAKWEMEENNSPESARKILQRALQFHPESQLLWREYFRMELMFVYQLRKRRELLKVDSLNEEENDGLLDGKIATIVYKEATSSITELEFALSFLPVCADFDFTEEHKAQVYNDIQKRFPDREETWDATAKRRLEQIANVPLIAAEEGIAKKHAMKKIVEDAFSIYEEAVEKIPTEKMWGFYIQTVLNSMEKAKSEKKVKKLLAHVLLLMKKAGNLSLLSPNLCIEWVRLLNTCGEHKEALEAVLKVVDLSPSSVALWKVCLVFLARDQDPRFSDYFFRAIGAVSEADAYPLWQLAVEWGTLHDFEELKVILEKGILQGPQISIPLKVTYLELVSMRLGAEETRELYNRLRKCRPLSSEFYEKMVFIEKSEVEPSMTKMRKYYDDAIMELGGSSVETWINYISLELQYPKGKPEAVGKLYYKAIKTLSPVLCDEFIKAYTLLSTGHDLLKHQDAL